MGGGAPPAPGRDAAARPYVSDAQTWRERRALYAELFAEHDPLLLLGRAEGQLAGYALGYTMPASGTWLADTWATGDRIGEVESLSVLPAYRGQGLGSRLLEQLHERLREQGAKDLIVGALAGNDDALRLYRRHGYQSTWLYCPASTAATPSLTRGRRPHDPELDVTGA